MRHFAVEGAGEFPIDMLRYDLCFPKTENDSYTLSFGVQWGASADGKRRIWLTTTKSTPITVKRWESFGWKVVEELPS